MSPSPQLVFVSRPTWLRLGDAVAECAAVARAALIRLVDRHHARTQRRRERAALRHLSPQVLRDIGASSELVAAALERDIARIDYAEPWRQGH